MTMKPEFEAAYLVDSTVYVYLKKEECSYYYQVFALDGEQIKWGNVDGETPEEAVHRALSKFPLILGLKVVQVGITTLKKFQQSEIYVRALWEPDSLPKDDIRFIDSQYNELFRIPNGSKIQVDGRIYHDVYTCEYIDDYHTYINGHCYHICQWAENLERDGRTCKPVEI